MFCSACGSEISLVADVCPSCGRVVAPVMAGATVRASTRGAAAQPAQAEATASGVWARRMAAPAEPLVSAPIAEQALAAEAAPPAASIFAGDLDQPGFPRDLPGRVVLLTAVAMTADLLAPWVTVRGQSFAPANFGLNAALLIAPFATIVIVPLFPRLRWRLWARALPLAVGALALGFGSALWLATIILNATVTAAYFGAAIVVGPALGLALFLIGACVLVGGGYLALTGHAGGIR